MTTRSSDNEMLRIVLLVLAFVILAPLLLMGGGMMMLGGGMMGGRMMGGTGGGFGILSFVMQLLWLVVLIGAVVLGYRWLARGGSIGSDPAFDELRIAYARGEITNEEFEERQAILRQE